MTANDRSKTDEANRVKATETKPKAGDGSTTYVKCNLREYTLALFDTDAEWDHAIIRSDTSVADLDFEVETKANTDIRLSEPDADGAGTFDLILGDIARITRGEDR